MATQLITRITPGPGATVKGELLTNVETDANFLSLNINKLERGNNLADLTDVAAARAALNVPSRSGGGGYSEQQLDQLFGVEV